MSDQQVSAAVVLCAGLGERLRPLTDLIPKGLLPIALKPALQWTIERLKEAAVSEFFFNTFHLADEIEFFANRQPDLNYRVIRERIIRGTGGGVENFRDFLAQRAFIVHNCDVFTAENLGAVLHFHREGKSVATLMVVDYPPVNSLEVRDGKILSFRKQAGNFTYSGVGVFSPRIWDYFPDKNIFSLIDVMEDALANGESIAAWRSAAYWSDFGTPSKYWDIHRCLARSADVRIDSSAVVTRTTLKGFNFISRDVVIKDSRLENCIVLPGSRVTGLKISNAIIHPGGVLMVDQQP